MVLYEAGVGPGLAAGLVRRHVTRSDRGLLQSYALLRLSLPSASRQPNTDQFSRLHNTRHPNKGDNSTMLKRKFFIFFFQFTAAVPTSESECELRFLLLCSSACHTKSDKSVCCGSAIKVGTLIEFKGHTYHSWHRHFYHFMYCIASNCAF